MPNTSLQRASIHKCHETCTANCFHFTIANKSLQTASNSQEPIHCAQVPVNLQHALPWYAASCYAAICYAASCYTVPCHAMLNHATQHHATLHPAMCPLVALPSWLLGQYHWYKSLMDLKRYISYVLHQNLWCYVAFLLTNAAQNLHSLLPTPHYNSI